MVVLCDDSVCVHGVELCDVCVVLAGDGHTAAVTLRKRKVRHVAQTTLKTHDNITSKLKRRDNEGGRG